MKYTKHIQPDKISCKECCFNTAIGGFGSCELNYNTRLKDRITKELGKCAETDTEGNPLSYYYKRKSNVLEWTLVIAAGVIGLWLIY